MPFQMVPRVQIGDFAGAEKHFKTGLEFFDDPGDDANKNCG